MSAMSVSGNSICCSSSKKRSELRSVTCHMGSHSVTCHPTEVNAPRLNPSQIGWYSIYLPRRDGKKDHNSICGHRSYSYSSSCCSVPRCCSICSSCHCCRKTVIVIIERQTAQVQPLPPPLLLQLSQSRGQLTQQIQRLQLLQMVS